MSFQQLVDKIFQRDDLAQRPPVLIDIGASMGLNPRWRDIARHCVCVAFDPDDRDFQYSEKADSAFKRLILVNKVVVGQANGERRHFFLTKNPYCSSLLRPQLDHLKEFSYAESFAVDRVAEVEAIDLPQVLQDLKVEKFDWIKIDSQGVDLQLFSSLPKAVREGAVALEFEPGLIHTYVGEDKLGHILSFMEESQHFLVDLKVCTAQRIPAATLDEVFPGTRGRKIANLVVPRVPAWTEIAYLNRIQDEAPAREFLLAWVFATIFGHDEIAYVYARRGSELKREPLFAELQSYSARRLRGRVYTLKNLTTIGRAAVRKLLGGRK